MNSYLASAPIDDRSHREALLATVSRYGGKYGKHVMTATAMTQLATPWVKWVRNKGWREQYTIKVTSDDKIYRELHHWVLAHMPPADRKSMLLETRREAMTRDSKPTRHRETRVELKYDGHREQQVMIDGYPVSVVVSQNDSAPDSLSLQRQPDHIVFTTNTVEGRDAIIEMVNDLVVTKYVEGDLPPVLLPSRWGGDWAVKDDLKPRTLDSVVLKDGQMERLVADLQKFLASEDEYDRVFQPYHRGYLFHGAPGTGKTSIARALANHFKMPVYYLPLSDIEHDSGLTSLIQQVPSQSMLLLEDVDVYHAATERNDAGDKASLSALLNALDGLWTPNGLITVLTTNNIDCLDDALIRAGRIDITEEFTVLDLSQIDDIVRYVYSDTRYPTQFEFPRESFVGKSPADLMEAIRIERIHSESL